jgi:hypothetical protein
LRISFGVVVLYLLFILLDYQNSEDEKTTFVESFWQDLWKNWAF